MWRDKLSPRLREALANEQTRAELLLELIRLLDERDTPRPAPRLTLEWLDVRLFEQQNPAWNEKPTAS